MNKKRIAAFALVACLTLSMAGCGESSEKAYDYDLSEYITLGQYKGIEIPASDIEVTDAEVQAEVQNRLSAATTTEEVKEGIVKDGDTVSIDYEGKKEGVAFEGGTAKAQDLEIGSGSFIPGFEEGLIGKSVGETVDIDLTFPEEYGSAELAGQDVVFTVKINAIKVKKVPEYNLDFVKANSEADSIKAYEESVNKDLAKAKEEEATNTKKSILWSKIDEATTVEKYPEKELQAFKEEYEGYLKQEATSMQITWEQYLEQMQITEEEYQSQLDEFAKQNVKQDMILYSIARAEGLEPTKEEYDAWIEKYMKDMGFDSEKAYREANGGKSLEELAGEKNIRGAIIGENVLAFVEKEATEVPEGTQANPAGNATGGAVDTPADGGADEQ